MIAVISAHLPTSSEPVTSASPSAFAPPRVAISRAWWAGRLCGSFDTALASGRLNLFNLVLPLPADGPDKKLLPKVETVSVNASIDLEALRAQRRLTIPFVRDVLQQDAGD